MKARTIWIINLSSNPEFKLKNKLNRAFEPSIGLSIDLATNEFLETHFYNQGDSDNLPWMKTSLMSCGPVISMVSVVSLIVMLYFFSRQVH